MVERLKSFQDIHLKRLKIFFQIDTFFLLKKSFPTSTDHISLRGGGAEVASPKADVGECGKKEYLTIYEKKFGHVDGILYFCILFGT